MTFLAKHPVWSLLILGVSILVALTGASEGFRKSIGNIYKNLFAMGGIDTGKMMMPESKKRASDLNKFNKALDGTKSSMDDLASSTGAAAKAAKGLLGFDEIFSIKSPDEDADSGITDALDDLGGLTGLDFSDLDIKMPSVDNIASDFVTNLVKALGGQNKILSSGIGSLLGMALGAIIGGPAGAKIGAVIGTLAGWIWTDIAEALNLTDVGTIAAPIATAIGAGIGFIIGGPGGLAIGVAIGALVGWIVDKITRAFETGNWTNVGKSIGAAIGAAIGFIVGGPGGALIGSSVGVLVGWVADMFIEGFSDGNWNVTGISLSIGGSIGAAIGMIAGGPGGAAIGAAVGGLIGWIVSLVINGWDGIVEWFGTAATDTANFFSDMAINTGAFFILLIANLMMFIGDVKTTVGNFFSNLFSDIGTFFSTLLTDIGNFFSDTFISIGAFFITLAAKTMMFISDAKTAVGNFFSWLLSSIGTFFGWVVSKLASFFVGLFTSIGKFFISVFTAIGNFFSMLGTSIGNFFVSVKTKLGTFFGGLGSSISSFFTNIASWLSGWVTDIWNNVFGKFFGWISDAIDKLKEFFGLDSKAKATDTSYTSTGKDDSYQGSKRYSGHATGGIFNREHVARFAEGNKAEAIIPLENADAMRPFVDAVSNGITAALLPIMVNMNGGSQNSTQPLYVGTLIADDRSLKELERKMQVIRLSETQRRT